MQERPSAAPRFARVGQSRTDTQATQRSRCGLCVWFSTHSNAGRRPARDDGLIANIERASVTPCLSGDFSPLLPFSCRFFQ